ncbi:MAG: class III signal peptide-containing protein [Methanobrevibacter sp.]|jgi:uncharacterized protein (UPF0333 family)|nr:class III signal peptide-containing protein [Candidatus Methanovirga basalitermitum]
MIKDNKGQLSIEYLLIVFISILILIAITLPALEFGISNSMDMMNILKIKSEAVKITEAANNIYYNGIGSKKTVLADIPKDTTIHLNSKNAYFDYMLSDGDMKRIYLINKCPGLINTVALSKGTNKIVVEWSINSNKIEISLI